MKTVVEPTEKVTAYHIPCSNTKCNAVMECQEKELTYHWDERDGDAWVLKCPHCRHESWYSNISQFAVRGEALK